jgi:6-phosphofructokinase 1
MIYPKVFCENEVNIMSRNCIVAQSGGPTAAINASLAGVISEVISSNKYNKIYGSINGIQGVLRNRFVEFSDKDDDFIQELIKTPAMYLGSCRFKLPDKSEDKSIYERIFLEFTEMDIGAFFYIGGNDSMDTVAKLSDYADSVNSDIRIIGIPKTIDNDLVLTDHTPGFGSAAKYVASSIREISYDTYIYDLESVNIVEIMGRDAGWLTAASVLARNSASSAPHMIYLPEVAFGKKQFITDLKEQLEIHKNVIVAVSEGIHDADGNYISATNAAADRFGHAQLSGAGKNLELLVKQELGIKVRSVEINVLQRCAGHMASKTDLNEAFASGKYGVTLAENGHTGLMAALKRTDSPDYSCEFYGVPVSQVANKAKSVPVEWITPDHHDVTKEMVEYLTPLVQGEVATTYENGIVSYLDVPHLTKTLK